MEALPFLTHHPKKSKANQNKMAAFQKTRILQSLKFYLRPEACPCSRKGCERSQPRSSLGSTKRHACFSRCIQGPNLTSISQSLTRTTCYRHSRRPKTGMTSRSRKKCSVGLSSRWRPTNSSQRAESTLNLLTTSLKRQIGLKSRWTLEFSILSSTKLRLNQYFSYRAEDFTSYGNTCSEVITPQLEIFLDRLLDSNSVTMSLVRNEWRH